MKEKRRLKICWQSNAPFSSSGYGQQTYDMERLLVANGWDGSNLAMINMFGHGGSPFVDGLGINNFPSIDHVAGSDAAVLHGRKFNADIVITLQDIWPMNPQDLVQIPRFIPWLPVDYDPVPRPILQNAGLSNRIIAMSRFGQDQLAKNGFSSTYIPHHVDTKIFFPVDKKKRKQELGIDPEMFIFGMVSANKDMLPRKSFQQVLEAFKMFHDIHPKSLLYIHTDPEQMGGFPVKNYAEFLGLGQSVGYPDKYKWRFDTPKEEMNLIYNAFDALLSPSSTEGFGIPIIEAQATGIPVIVNDYTSMPELIRNEVTGFKTRVGCQHFMPIGSYMKFPNVNDLHDKMELLFRSNLVTMGVESVRWIKKNYDMQTVWHEHWQPFLEGIEYEIYGKPPIKKLTDSSVTV